MEENICINIYGDTRFRLKLGHVLGATSSQVGQVLDDFSKQLGQILCALNLEFQQQASTQGHQIFTWKPPQS